MSVEIRPATQEDVPALARVLSQAAAHKADQGDYLWGTEPFTDEEIEAKLQAGGLYAVTSDGEIAGTLTLTDQDERIWEDGGEAQEALYIHQLATSDDVRGQNIGGQIIDWVVEKAQADGRKAVRLDCSYTNRGLCQYYERRGFVEVKRRDIPRKHTARDLRDPVYQAALLQRDVRPAEAAEAEKLYMGGVTVELGPESSRFDFAHGAVGLTDATVTDLWHLSGREIDKFEDSKGTDEVSKHGSGTYVGGGRLGGTQIEAIKTEDHHRYDLKFEGNVLMVPFTEYDDTAWELEELLAKTGAELPMQAPGRMINKALREHAINGVAYDAFLLFADPKADKAGLTEGVIFYPEKCLQIEKSTVIPKE